MSDDLEPRLREAFNRGSLPSAPAELVDALERVPDAPVRDERARGGRAPIGLLAAAIVLIAAGAVAISGGSSPRPRPSSSATATPSGEVASRMVGSRLYLEFTARPVGGVAPKAADMAKIADILRSRVATTGVAGATVAVYGADIVVQLPGVTDADPFLVLVGQPGRVDFVGLGNEVVRERSLMDLAVTPSMFGGEGIESAHVGSGNTAEPVISITLKPAAAAIFAKYTRDHIGSSFAIVRDGSVLAVPIIQSEIADGQVDITFPATTRMSQAELSTLIAWIRSGALPFPIEEMVSEVVDGPSPSVP